MAGNRPLTEYDRKILDRLYTRFRLAHLNNIIKGAMISAKDAHGNITKDNTHHATKRIVKGIWGDIKTIIMQSDCKVLVADNSTEEIVEYTPDKRFMIFAEGKQEPIYAHSTEEEALIEARRIARLPDNHDRRIYLLECKQIIECPSLVERKG